MATPLDNVNASIANICTIIASITANPQPSYSVQGVSVSWSEYLAQLTDQLEKLQEASIFLSGPYQQVTVGIS